jgi:hypothetical protein
VIKTLISFSKVLRSNLNEFEKIGFKKKSIVLILKNKEHFENWDEYENLKIIFLFKNQIGSLKL